jgi:hypothetical protein
VVLRYVDDTVVQDTDWTPQSPELHGWSAEDIAQVKNIPRPKDIARLMNVGRVKDFVRPKDLGSKSPLAAVSYAAYQIRNHLRGIRQRHSVYT